MKSSMRTHACMLLSFRQKAASYKQIVHFNMEMQPCFHNPLPRCMRVSSRLAPQSPLEPYTTTANPGLLPPGMQAS